MIMTREPDYSVKSINNPITIYVISLKHTNIQDVCVRIPDNGIVNYCTKPDYLNRSNVPIYTATTPDCRCISNLPDELKTFSECFRVNEVHIRFTCIGMSWDNQGVCCKCNYRFLIMSWGSIVDSIKTLSWISYEI